MGAPDYEGAIGEAPRRRLQSGGSVLSIDVSQSRRGYSISQSEKNFGVARGGYAPLPHAFVDCRDIDIDRDLQTNDSSFGRAPREVSDVGCSERQLVRMSV